LATSKRSDNRGYHLGRIESFLQPFSELIFFQPNGDAVGQFNPLYIRKSLTSIAAKSKSQETMGAQDVGLPKPPLVASAPRAHIPLAMPAGTDVWAAAGALKGQDRLRPDGWNISLEAK
jgi:hypothetical protein